MKSTKEQLINAINKLLEVGCFHEESLKVLANNFQFLKPSVREYYNKMLMEKATPSRMHLLSDLTLLEKRVKKEILNPEFLTNKSVPKIITIEINEYLYTFFPHKSDEKWRVERSLINDYDKFAMMVGLSDPVGTLSFDSFEDARMFCATHDLNNHFLTTRGE